MGDEPQIISRKDARALGLKRYFTGKPCRRGHVMERYTPSGRCLGCNKVLCSAWQNNNRDWLNDYFREWYGRDLEGRRLHLRERRAANPDELKKHNERNARWREENPGWVTEWRKNNPDQDRVLRERRRAQQEGAEGAHTAADIREIHEMQKGRCAYCRKKLGTTYQIDHIIPLSKGGSNYPNNIQLLCEKGKGACNQQKSAKDPMVYARSIGLLL